MAGSVTYIAPVENASGKIFGKKSRFCAVTRTWGKRKRGCTAMGVRDLKNHPYTEAEQLRKIKFAAVAQATRDRMADTEKLLIDQAAFKAQSKYTTFYQYVWNQEWQAYQG